MGGSLSDNFDLSVVLKIAAQGGKATSEELEALQDRVDELARSGAITEKEVKNLTSAIGKNSDENKKAEQSTRKNTESVNAQRYALYEVAAAYGAVSAALIGVGASTVSAFSEMEAGFTKVERTSGMYGEAFAPLEADLLSLGRSIPTLTAGMQDLASRGAQMGIAAGDVAGFTEVLAKFVATSPEVDVNSVAESFGRLSNLTGTKDFEAMASAIAKVGVNSAATDAQIIKTTQELARATSSTTLAADEVIGLAAAMASLGVAPEAARGVMNQFFVQLEKGAAGMNDSLDVAAQVMGTTTEEATKLFQTDTGTFFQSFVAGLPNVDSVTVALDAMGLSGQRLIPAFNALSADTARNAEGQSVLAKALSDSNAGFKDRNELEKQYAPIADDLASRQVILANSLKELAFEIGKSLAPALKASVDLVSKFVQGLSDLASTPAGRVLTVMAASVGALTAAYTSLRTIVALAAATQIAFNTAAGSGMAKGLVGQLGMLVTGFTGVSASAVTAKHAVDGATGATSRFRVALASTGIGLALVAVGALAAAFMQLGDSAEEAYRKYVGTASGMGEAVAQDTAAYNEAVQAGLTDLADAFVTVTPSVEGLTSAQKEARDVAYQTAGVLGVDLSDGASSAADSMGQLTYALGENSLAWVKQSLMASESFQNLVSEGGLADVFAETGADFNTLMTIALNEGEQGLVAYWQDLAKTNDSAASLFHDGAIAWFSRIGQSFATMAKDLFNWNNFVTDLKKSFGDADALAASVARGSKVKSELDRIWSDPVLKGSVNDFNKLLVGTAGELKAVGAEASRVGTSAVPAFESADKSLRDMGNSAREAAAEVRTLIDYANDLSSVWNRAFEIRFSSGQAEDKITKTFLDLKKAAEDSAQKIKDIRGEIRGLNADIGVLQSDIGTQKYFLSVALEYGDTKRAEVIQANLVKLQADLAKKQDDLAKKQKDLTKEQDSNSKSLVGNSEQAIKNRETVLGLVQSYQSQIEALAKSGLSSAELARKTEQLRQDFIKQATQLGFNRVELARYTKGFDDVRVAIAKVPTNITVKANANPALQALEELRKKAVATSGAVNGVNSALNGTKGGMGYNAPAPIFNDLMAKARVAAIRVEALARVVALQAQLASSSHWTTKIALLPQIAYWKNLANSFATGGYTGAGGKYEPAGIVHKGEYVVKKEHVNQRTGLPYADAMGKLVKGSQPTNRGYANGGFVSGSSMGPLDLSAASIQQLARVLKTEIVIGDKLIGDVASRSYAGDTRVGAN